jgi:hypothetical protein
LRQKKGLNVENYYAALARPIHGFTAYGDVTLPVELLSLGTYEPKTSSRTIGFILRSEIDGVAAHWVF